MKIFISHSSKDKWAARRISEDLISNGAETFLDEKDINTGESIDTEIRKHLKSCDDFLIILSPASISSEWVLLELGGALALEKKVIPILLYVGPNEIPKAISLKLARDINTIDLYYTEVANQIKGKKTKAIRKKIDNTEFPAGTIVKVISKRPKDVLTDDYLIDWEESMDMYLGQIYKVKDKWRGGYILHSNDGHEFAFAKEWLTPMEE